MAKPFLRIFMNEYVFRLMLVNGFAYAEVYIVEGESLRNMNKTISSGKEELGQVANLILRCVDFGNKNCITKNPDITYALG